MELKAGVVSNADALAKVFAVRAAVYMSEQGCPYEEEFDGNDYSCTHILGYVDDAPAAVMRIRYFAEFVKFERVAILPRYRRSGISQKLMQTAMDVARRKGYRHLYGHAQKRLTDYWANYGFKPLNKNFPLVFSDHEYVEVVAELEPHAEAITLHSDPYVILRREGDWDNEGPLERSAARPATNPH